MEMGKVMVDQSKAVVFKQKGERNIDGREGNDVSLCYTTYDETTITHQIFVCD
jgi:hypothetical protein